MADTKYLIGTSGWSYDSWREIFYPKEIPKKDWLSYYATHFPIVELNATFYQFFTPKTYLKWRDSVPNRFRFIVKVPRIITHYKQLLNCDKQIKAFNRLVDHLDNRLALLLLQLGPNTTYHPERLEQVLQSFKRPQKIVVEFRNQVWLTEEVKEVLKANRAIYCMVDSPTMRLTTWHTGKIAYIRLHGRTQWYAYHYSTRELNGVAKFARKLAKCGAKKIYILLNNDYEAYAPENATYLQTILK